MNCVSIKRVVSENSPNGFMCWFKEIDSGGRERGEVPFGAVLNILKMTHNAPHQAKAYHIISNESIL